MGCFSSFCLSSILDIHAQKITALIRPFFYGSRQLDLWIAKAVSCWTVRDAEIWPHPSFSLCGWREFERAERSRESSKRSTVWHAADVPGYRVWSGSARRLPGTLSLLCPTQQGKALFTTKLDSSNKLEPLIPQDYHSLQLAINKIKIKERSIKESPKKGVESGCRPKNGPCGFWKGNFRVGAIA